MTHLFVARKWARRVHPTKATHLSCSGRACAIRLQRDVSTGSWCACLIRLVCVGTKRHTAEVGYFWLISTLHPHTSWHSCIRLRLPSREQPGEKDEQQQQQEKRRRGSFVAASGKREEMIRAPLKRNHPLCLLKADFFNSCRSCAPIFHGETCYFNKRQLAHTKKKILLGTLCIQIWSLHYSDIEIRSQSSNQSLLWRVLCSQSRHVSCEIPKAKARRRSISRNMHGLHMK